MNIDPRTIKYKHEIMKLNKVDEYDIKCDKGTLLQVRQEQEKQYWQTKLKHCYNQLNIVCEHQHIRQHYYMRINKQYIVYLTLINTIIHI